MEGMKVTTTQVDLSEVKVGDRVRRMLAGTVPMYLTVTKLDDELIYCGEWTFDRATGVEVDDDLRWGPEHGYSGSFISEVIPKGDD